MYSQVVAKSANDDQTVKVEAKVETKVAPKREIASRAEQDLRNAIATNGTNTLVIMRGLPGSGKTTLANKLLRQFTSGVVLSTDDYFVRNGIYRYDPNLISEAHEWNQSRARTHVRRGRSPVIIDNTNLKEWEMRPYLQMAAEAEYAVLLAEPDTPWSRDVRELSRRNVHNIPREKIEIMRDNFAELTVDDLLSNARKARNDSGGDTARNNRGAGNGGHRGRSENVFAQRGRGDTAGRGHYYSANNNSALFGPSRSAQTNVDGFMPKAYQNRGQNSQRGYAPRGNHYRNNNDGYNYKYCEDNARQVSNR